MSDNEDAASNTSIDIFDDSPEINTLLTPVAEGRNLSPDIFDDEDEQELNFTGAQSPKYSTAEFHQNSKGTSSVLQHAVFFPDNISPIPPCLDSNNRSIVNEDYEPVPGPSNRISLSPVESIQDIVENEQTRTFGEQMDFSYTDIDRPSTSKAVYSQSHAYNEKEMRKRLNESLAQLQNPNLDDPRKNEQSRTLGEQMDFSYTDIDRPSTSKVVYDPMHVYNEKEMRQRLDESLAQLQNPNLDDPRNWSNYMQLKKDKLRYQVNVMSRPSDLASLLFKGISIFVNGYTVPTALELREMIQSHGGHYHCYYEYGKTTYTIASSLASVKVDKLRKEEKLIKADWVVDSIAANRKLPIEPYLLTNEGKRPVPKITSFMTKANGEKAESLDESRILDARDPNFLQQFYSRSRLHLISELAQEMRDFMSGLRGDENLLMSGFEDLKKLSGQSSPNENVIFHVDLDCFFVSVALRTHPNLVGKPVAVTHSRGNTSAGGFAEIASCSYAARSQGCRNGMLIRDAVICCPALVCLPYQFDEYKEVSKSIYSIMASFSKEVKAVSCDEMYVNFTNICKNLNITDPRQIAVIIRERIRECTGCPASVGIGPTILLARLATRHAKPDGIHWVQQRNVIPFIAKESLSNLPGIGHTIKAKLTESFGSMETCSDLQLIPEEDLAGLLGVKTAKHIFQMCRGEDNSVNNFMENATRKSVSCDINYGIRFTERAEVLRFVLTVCEELNRKLTNCKMFAASVTLKLMIRSPDAPIETDKYLGHGRCDTVSKTALLKKHTSDIQILYREVVTLFDVVKPVISDLRGIGVHCGRLSPSLHSVGQLTSEDLNKFFRPRPVKRTLNDLSSAQDNAVITIDDRPPKIQRKTIRMIQRKVNYCQNENKRLMHITKIILGFMDKDPSEENVKNMTEYIYKLYHRKEFGSLESTRRFMLRMLDQDKYHDWLFPTQYIWTKIEDMRLRRHGVKESKHQRKNNAKYEKSLLKENASVSK